MGFEVKSIIGIVCLVLQFIVFLFVIVATPIDVLRWVYSPLGDSICYSMWGLKHCGGSQVSYGDLRYKGFFCAAISDMMTAAAAFAIVSIFLTLVGLLVMIVRFIKVFKTPNFVPVAVCGAACLTILISWACIAGAKYQYCGDRQPFRQYDLYGGFGLLVTAWILELAVCILIFFS